MSHNHSNKERNTSDTALENTRLRIEYLPEDNYVFSNDDVKYEIACRLFNCSPEQIINFRKDPHFNYFKSIRHIEKFNVELNNGDNKSFYIKNSWEGKYLEGCGMALHNIFSIEQYNFILSEKKNSKLIITEHVLGATLWDMEPYHFNQTNMRNYGYALEFASMIGLTDRDSKNNFILTPEDNIINLDFGKIFQKQYSTQIDACIRIPKNLYTTFLKSRKEAKEKLLTILESNKENIESIIEETNNLKGFENSMYREKIIPRYITDPYNTFKTNIENTR